MNDILLTNARWLTPEGRFEHGSLAIRKGRIEKLNRHSPKQDTLEIHDVSGYLILPGAIDPHVHFREPGQRYKEGIANGSKAALCGGVTTIIDMPNNKPPTTTSGRVRQKKELFARKSHVNWGIMLHTRHQIDNQTIGKTTSAKVYMAKSSSLPAITEPQWIKDILGAYPLVSFHAEDETAFQSGENASPLHHEKRPREAVIRALHKIETALKELPADKRARVVICHMNTADEVKWISRMRAGGFDVWGETCPHYLYFTQDDYVQNGSAFQVNPPIRTERDRDALLQALADGTVHFMGTDHAPHTQTEKSGSRPPSGIAAIEWLMPQVLHLIDEGVIDWKRFHQLLTGGAAQCYNIKHRDGIRVGNYADLVLVKRLDQNKNTKIYTRSGVNLYQKFGFKWCVCRTYVNGQLKYNGKKFFEDGRGIEV